MSIYYLFKQLVQLSGKRHVYTVNERTNEWFTLCTEYMKRKCIYIKWWEKATFLPEPSTLPIYLLVNSILKTFHYVKSTSSQNGLFHPYSVGNSLTLPKKAHE